MTLIDRPLGEDVQISWSDTDKTVSRGGYTKVTTFDGFGRPICVLAEGLSQRTGYDGRGNRIFQSFVENKACDQITNGTRYTFDFLNRPDKIIQNDGSEIKHRIFGE